MKLEDFASASDFNETSRCFFVLARRISVASMFSEIIPRVRAVFLSLSAASGSAFLAKSDFMAFVEFVLAAITRSLLSCS